MLGSPAEPQLGGKNAAHFQKNVARFNGASRLMADVHFNGPTVARIRIDRMGFPLPSWNLKGKGVGSHSYYCNDVIPARVCINHISTILLNAWEMKFPSNFRQKAMVWPSVTRTFIKLNQQTVCGLETWSHWRENSFRLVLFAFFPLVCRNILTKEVGSSVVLVQRKSRLLQTVWQITLVMYYILIVF